ncbi:hypothetical protein [Bacillus pumilus]|uniref:hypothetical protein n=1 Tax=Bacillus pumilus TaxID=1408 RepID=UPI00119EC1C8|nr:hypothetical protein [Bacillus pumilus]
MLILLWIVSFFTAFFLMVTLVYFFILLYTKHPRPFHQACELTVYVSFIYPLSLLVTASFIFIMMLLFPLYWLRGR